MSFHKSCVFFSLVGLITIIFTVKAGRVSSITEVQKYLTEFGYLSAAVSTTASDGLLNENTFTEALKDFQSFAGLKVTGILDRETLNTMSLRRCGMHDRKGFHDRNRSQRYAIGQGRWPSNEVSYGIFEYPKKSSNMTTAEVDSEIARAFAIWSESTDLKFTRRQDSSNCDISIKFVSREHGDGNPFDGAGNVVAHGFYPISGGDVHFDDDETWTLNTPEGTNLFQVAGHEFGHALGLGHSDVNEAVMAPFYKPYTPTIKLTADDIAGIQSIYGIKSTNSPPRALPPSPPKSPRNKHLCEDSKFDTICNTPDGRTYVFKGDKYYKLEGNSIAKGYPKQISEGWPGLPENIDASFTYGRQGPFFFKDFQYWEFNGHQMKPGFPKEVSQGLSFLPQGFDTIMYRNYDRTFYVFTGKFYQTINTKNFVASSPKHISELGFMTNALDAAFEHTNGTAYFFENGQYYRLDDKTNKVEIIKPEYPRSTRQYFFGC